MPKTRKIQVIGSIKSEQPDWNQTDSTQSDYIKNKPAVGETISVAITDDVLVVAQNPDIYQKGEDGHTPIKGIDYFTNVDKQEIIDAVLAVLPETGQTVYVVGASTDFTLSANDWDGTNYTLRLDRTKYEIGNNLQIGIPSQSSMTNAQLLTESALTISNIGLSALQHTITITAVTAPSKDIVVTIYGVTPIVAQESGETTV